MRKFLSVIAFAIVTVGLIVGGAIVLAQVGKLTNGLDLSIDAMISSYGFKIGLGIALLISGIGAAVGTIASFFTAKTRDK